MSSSPTQTDKENLLNQPLSAPRDRSENEPVKSRRERSRSRDRQEQDRRNDRHNAANKSTTGAFKYYEVVKAPPDEKLGDVKDDPRGNDPTTRITKKATGRGHGRNTESFDPASTLVRPDLRIQIGSPALETYNKPLKHDDVVIVPELFGPEENWDLYYKLVEEMREIQQESDKKENKGSEWISWHEGAHLISKNPKGSPTYNMIIDRLCEYFSIDKSKDVGTRFNWYRDSSDWKPFHHDSAAFNPQRARNQNITIGASFGATRELAFIRAKEYDNGEKCKLYFPQVNNGVFSFGRDANILWKHGVNALPPDEQDGKGRISIILWGLASKAIEEDGSPPLLGSDGRGPHANKGRHHNHRGGGRHNGRRDDRRHHHNDHRRQHDDRRGGHNHDDRRGGYNHHNDRRGPPPRHHDDRGYNGRRY
ncbi:hypothetical protein CTEN210_16890 [Chaetoceros tenuissimus]|uniref:Fe2OG dioxygenase domain-containing protein n=1 Tax=Chaetoceros tenuissimus TaxID=426638 RepID=A0AAD3D9R0_9STRA|nr:hypothetical protein CTEN210_16890 [Chaetoceros tenuissimus]